MPIGTLTLMKFIIPDRPIFRIIRVTIRIIPYRQTVPYNTWPSLVSYSLLTLQPHIVGLKT